MAVPDAHTNFAYSTVNGTTTNNGTNPGYSGTAINLTSVTPFPAVPFNATVWPTGTQPTSANAEIVRCTALSTNSYTVTRNQEGSGPRYILNGDQFAATITTKTLNDAERINYSYSPYILASAGTSGQTLATSSNNHGGQWIYAFPITVSANLQFNEVLLADNLSQVLSNAVASNTYYSKFGLYSLSNNSALSLISSNSFSIGEVASSTKVDWTFPTTTVTSGYGYGGFLTGSITRSNEIVSYISGTRAIGLQFGGPMALTQGIYWLGLLSVRSTGDGNSAGGISNIGILGNIINPVNSVGSVSGPTPMGVSAAGWTTAASHISAWWGRHVVGFVTSATTNALPSAISLSDLAQTSAGKTGNVLPTVTFVSY